MQEIQSEYLKQLGIAQWLPRQPLPGAAPSPDWVYRFVHPAQWLDDEAHEEDFESARPSPPAKPARGRPEPHAEQRAIAHIHQALEPSTPAGKPTRPAAETPVAAPTPRPEIQPAPRFRLAFAKTERTLFVDQLPVQGSLGFSRQHNRLLAGIARAMGDDPASLSMPVVVEWPLLAGKTLNQGPQEAFKSVQRQLEWMLKSAQVERMLLLGEGLPNWVVELGADAQVAQGVHPRWMLPYVCTASLSQALQLPDFKRQIWLDLQPLLR